MSLFAGTSFIAPGSKNDGKQEAERPAVRREASPPTIAPASLTTAPPEPASSVANSKNAPPAASGPSNWSAALRFAPAAASRKPKPTAASTFKPVSFLPSGFKPAASNSSISASAFSATPVPSATSVSFSAPPTRPTGTTEAPGPSFKAPAMTLEEPASGSSKAGNARRPPNQGSNKRRRKRAKLDELLNAPVHVFQPLEAYDPSKPNDLQEWREYRKAIKEEARQRRRQEREREEEARRRARYGSTGTESSEYETEEEEDRPRRDAPRAFAPPTSLYARPADKEEEAEPLMKSAASSAPTFTEAPALSEEEAQARRAAMAQSAEDAYARRVAMSAGRAQAPLEPMAAPSPMPAAAAPAVTLQQSAVEAEAPKDFAKLLEERKAAAAAIAAKLAAFKAPEQTAAAADEPVEDVDPDELLASLSKEVERDATSTFAEKMMRKWGHQEGTGLGSRGDGIVHALSAEHAKASGSSKQNDGKRGWVHSTSAMGRLVNLNENEQRKADLERYGDPSEVVCLRNVVAGPHEVDGGLADEIAEECNKNGVVEKVVIHIAPVPLPRPNDHVRIFVRFSGLAGAWRTVKEMDGRFFGGRQVRATYYPLIRFERNEKDAPLVP